MILRGDIMGNIDNIYIDCEQRIIYLSDIIDNITIGKITFFLLEIIKNDDRKEKKEIGFSREPIQLYINSCGGNICDMWSLITIIENSKTPIHTYCNGYAYSAACTIFVSGHRRFIGKHAELMYHQMSHSNKHTTYQDNFEYRKMYDKSQKELEKYIISKTKIKKNLVDKIRKNKIDYYIYAENAIKLGFADEII